MQNKSSGQSSFSQCTYFCIFIETNYAWILNDATVTNCSQEILIYLIAQTKGSLIETTQYLGLQQIRFIVYYAWCFSLYRESKHQRNVKKEKKIQIVETLSTYGRFATYTETLNQFLETVIAKSSPRISGLNVMGYFQALFSLLFELRSLRLRTMMFVQLKCTRNTFK